MKRRVLKALSLCLALVFAAAIACPVFAVETTVTPFDAHDTDIEKLYAFWHQPAYNGLNNGEAVYDHEWPEYNYYCGDPHDSYNDTWMTRLVGYFEEQEWIILDFHYYEGWWICEETDYGPLYGDGEEEVYPDLYGPMDLSETNMLYLYSPWSGQTHITSVDLDGCTKLNRVAFNGQEYCTSISALGMNNLIQFSAKDCAYTHVAFSPSGFENDVVLNALGNGTVGAQYYDQQGEYVTLYACPKQGKFVGWFENGRLVSEELEYTITEGADLTAYFGGDADGDGSITAADALILLRAAMGITQTDLDVFAMDVSGNGALDASDALTVLRLSLGLL